MSRPTVSIGLPVYNGARFLPEALESLLAQTFEDFELIISDNASTDETPLICRAYAERDARIRVVRNENNLGVYRNCNRVIALAAGTYFKLASADDICHRELVASCVQALESDSSIVAVYGKTRFMDEHGTWLREQDPGWHLMSESRLERLRSVIVSGHWVNVFFGLTRSHALARTRLFPLYAGGDCRLLGELALQGKLCELPEYLFFRRLHTQASSQNRDLEWQSYFFRGRDSCVELPFWHVCFDHTTTVLRSDLSSYEKMACIRAIADRMFSGKRSLLRELQTASRILCGRYFPCR